MENQTSKIMLTGDGGQLAWELKQTCPSTIELISLSRHQLDITDSRAVMLAVNQHQPQCIINAAAYTAVDKAESEKESAYAVNALGSENLALACLNHSISLVHISTDFIFDGKKSTPYLPHDTARPINVYGASKLAGERKIAELLKDNATIIRTAWVYSANGNNFVNTMLRLMNERDSLSVVSDQIGTPTWARGLAHLIWTLIEKKLTPDDKKENVQEQRTLSLSHNAFEHQTQILQWTDAGTASWYDFAVAIQDIGLQLGLLNKRITIRPIPASQYPTPATRPNYSVMDKTDAETASGLTTQHWQHQLFQMMEALIKK